MDRRVSGELIRHFRLCRSAIFNSALVSNGPGTGLGILPKDDQNKVPFAPVSQLRSDCSTEYPDVWRFSLIEDRTEQQWQRWEQWLKTVNSDRLVTIELGAGLAVPTVRHMCQQQPGTLIRVNPFDAGVRPGGIALPVGALEALKAIDDELKSGFGWN